LTVRRRQFAVVAYVSLALVGCGIFYLVGSQIATATASRAIPIKRTLATVGARKRKSPTGQIPTSCQPLSGWSRFSEFFARRLAA
jgi:hypothetical protein